MRWFSTVVALAAVASGRVRADDYYVAVFAAESVPFKPVNTHAFVGAVRVPAGGGPAEVVSISWLPSSLNVRVTLRPEEGVNYGLRPTADIVTGKGWRLSVWGPYQTDAELFCRLKGQAARLDSGAQLYKSTDNFASVSRVLNCYHALWMPVSPSAARGFAGAFTPGDRTGGKTVELYSPWIKDACHTHDEILGLLGMADVPMCRRGFTDRPTRRDAVRSFISR